LSLIKSKEDIAQEIYELEERLKVREGLPFLHGFKFYKWSRKFYDSTNKYCLCTAANQVSKSSTQIRTLINWATNKKLWEELWVKSPTMFWYFYPSQDVVNAEFISKWSQFLPKNEYKDSEEYGWEELKKGKNTLGVKFNSGVVVYFKTYSQSVSNLQSSTLDAVWCDEELPIEYYEELMFRLSASNGYFRMVFTATLGQDFWRRCMEPGEGEKEELVGAEKITASMYDCLVYEDGSKSHWTVERIKEIERLCSSPEEILKRVHGKFITLAGRRVDSFDVKKHVKKKHPVPPNWLVYVGCDIGSGGESGHPSAICYVAVNPNMQEGRIIKVWRGDGEITTAGDVVNKNIELKKKYNIKPVRQFYDWASKDFYNIATRAGEAFEKAEKDHEIGFGIINTLFKNNMLYIYDDDDSHKLVAELLTIKHGERKNKSNDDLLDATRYALSKIPWDWSVIKDVNEDRIIEEELSSEQLNMKARRDFIMSEEEENLNDDFEELNEYYG
jgi:phage terminase large subunit-like protein